MAIKFSVKEPQQAETAKSVRDNLAEASARQKARVAAAQPETDGADLFPAEPKTKGRPRKSR